MGYCSSCGEALEGRFCRMCGTPFGAPADAEPAGASLQAQQAKATHSPAHAVPNTDFDALFRRADGEVNPHSRTQLLPPVDADYRMPPPGALPSFAPAAATQQVSAFPADPAQLSYPPQPGAFPAGGHPAGPYPGAPGGPDRTPPGEPWEDEDEPSVRKPVLWGGLAAIAVVSAIILGLIYIGGRNNGAAASTSPTGTANTALTSTAQPSIGQVQLPSAVASPSASASPSPSAGPSQSQPTGGTTLPLSQGSTGNLVHYVQNRLRTLGYYHGSVNGQYDMATAQAVIEFQAHVGITADPAGVVGRSTYTALIAAGTKPNLRFNQRSGDVKRLQEALDSAEGANLTVNSRYDAATFQAVRAYQQAVGLEPTGTTNAATWSALQSGKLAG